LVPRRFEPAFDILPAAQQEIWPRLVPAPRLSLVLYGGTAIALQLGHRQSVDFDFFSSEPLQKEELRIAFGFDETCSTLQDSPETLVVSARMPSGQVKLSFFGALKLGRVGEPLLTEDGVLLVASLEDLLATKLKTILDRAEARDYRDIAAMLKHGLSLAVGLAAFRAMFAGEPAQVLRALGFFEDGNLSMLDRIDRETLTSARDKVRELPTVRLTSKSLTAQA
jgi:hypothetical protein